MRRLGLLGVGVGAAVFGLATPALAQPSPSAAAPGQAADVACTLSDNRLTGLTGLVARPDGGYVVVNTGSQQANPMRVYYLNGQCKVDKFVSYPAPARDPEDLAVASDGTLWVADIGDNATNAADRRQTIALWKVPSGGGSPVIHRLTYPDGPHDARALLFGPNDTPIIVTKELSGTAQIYEPAGPLQANNKQGVPLKNVGSWKPRRTGTSNLLGATGQILVTGAAQSPDRKRVVLRTYSDAYEWNVPDGDIVKAITTGTPRITPLPGEPQGEGIAFSADGTTYLTCSNQAAPGKILRYRPAAVTTQAVPATGKAVKKADGRPWYQKLSLPQIIDIVAGIGVLGLVLVVVGVIGIRRSRKGRRAAAGWATAPGAGTPRDDLGAAADSGPITVDPTRFPRGGAPAGAPRSGGRAVVGTPVDPARQGGRASAPPAQSQRGGAAQPARGGQSVRGGQPPYGGQSPARGGAQPVRGGQPPYGGQPPAGGGAQPPRGGGGGRVYGGGGGYAGPGSEQRGGGRQEFAPPGYRPDHDIDARY